MEDGRAVKLYGDKNNPISRGFSCIRGREMANYAELPSRLRTSLARDTQGKFQPIASSRAAQEVAEKLKAIVARHGPRSVAVFAGSFCVQNTLTNTFTLAFWEALGSPMYFTPEPIDQPGKPIANALHGRWLGGTLRHVDGFDVMLLIGSNPLVSGGGPFGTVPAANLHQARKAGTKLIVVDPRVTETATHADIYLQPRPAEDAAILAGMVRVILHEKLYDREFVAAEANGLEALRQAVEPYDPQTVAARADISADALIAAARLYASAKRGLAHVGTGPNMSGHSNLVEYLARVLNTLCGHWPRAGERFSNPGVLVDWGKPVAASSGPLPVLDPSEKLRVLGLTRSAAGMPTGQLIDEILEPGEGQVRALFVIGGNPMVGFPDQEKTLAALKSLDLLVCLDPRLSQTARLAHYVIAPTLPLETAGVCGFWEQAIAAGVCYGFDVPYQQYSPALVPPPPGGDVVDEWRFLYDVAAHMGLSLTVKSAAAMMGTPEQIAAASTRLDKENPMTTEEAWACVFKGSPVPFDEVRDTALAGRVFDRPEVRIDPKPEGWTAKFDIGSAPMMEELAEVATDANAAADVKWPFRMISRRLHDIFNSNWVEHEPLKRRWRTNPAFMHPADMAVLGLASGDLIRITSRRASVVAVTEAEAGVKRGCISLAHGWGANPDEGSDPFIDGATTSRLSDNETNCDRFSGIPIMSAIPVSIERVETAPESMTKAAAPV
jgi:anaerobic selenocysteine-containing dehydrogenase